MSRTTTETSVWLDALQASSSRLNTAVANLPDEVLARPSFTGGWTIAQVLSHLGSAAEICTTLVKRGIAADATGPVAERLGPIWRRWDSLSGPDQREAWQQADARHLRLLGSLDEHQRETVRIPYFSGLLSVDAYAGYRLSEQSVHAWDIEVALDETATIPAPEVALLWQRLDLVATRFRDAETLARLAPTQIAVELAESRRILSLHLNAELHLYPCEAADPSSQLYGPAEAVLRMVYGRHHPVDDIRVTGSASLADLTALFPGY